MVLWKNVWIYTKWIEMHTEIQILNILYASFKINTSQLAKCHSSWFLLFIAEHGWNLDMSILVNLKLWSCVSMCTPGMWTFVLQIYIHEDNVAITLNSSHRLHFLGCASMDISDFTPLIVSCLTKESVRKSHQYQNKVEDPTCIISLTSKLHYLENPRQSKVCLTQTCKHRERCRHAYAVYRHCGSLPPRYFLGNLLVFYQSSLSFPLQFTPTSTHNLPAHTLHTLQSSVFRRCHSRI